MLDLDAPITSVPVAYVDVETTGLNPFSGDRVVEIAVLRCVGEEPQDAFLRLIDPQRPMSPDAYAIHHISDAMLAGQPTFGDVAGEMLQVLSGAVYIGHNLAFDLGFLESELRRAGVAQPEYIVGLDTLRLARRRYALPRYGLEYLARSLRLEIGAHAHRAMADVLLTRLVFERLLDDLASETALTTRYLQALQGGRIHERRPTLPPVPPIISQAVQTHTPLRLRYRSGNGNESERTVTPLGLVDHGDTLTLVADCHLRQERRSFRLDRIIAVELAPEE